MGMDLSVDAFNGLLGQMQSFAWRAAFACPCVDINSGDAKQGCPVCNGKGRIWNAEVGGPAGMQNMSNQKGFAMFGTWAPGDALFTIGSDSPLYAMKQYDRVRCINSQTTFSLVVVPGANDKLLGTISAVSRVFWLNTDGTAVIEGAIPVVGTDGSLSWPDGGGPPSDTPYSVAGSRYDEYYVFQQLPANRNDSNGELLPQKLQLRRFDLFNR